MSCSVPSSPTCPNAETELWNWGQLGQAEWAEHHELISHTALTGHHRTYCEDFFLLFCQSHALTRLICYESEGIPVAGTIHPHTGDCRLLQSMICTLNCWDRWYWRYTSHHILAENLISLSTEDGRKCSTLHFMCLAQVLEKPVLPVFTEAENSFHPSLLALIFPMLLFLSEVFAHGSFQLPGNTVQLCFRTSSWWLL